ncbi:hypothetical protein GCM10009819_00650 [Agromyces tropicus]|uniref:Uncharacterized protein n=1 Tax=Agromyces tropicus TaxID=555371 RepID=A0ABN2TUR4_9MICO
MTEDMQPNDPLEGEYTDSELPLDAEVPKDGDAVAVDDEREADGVVVEEVEVVEVVETDDPAAPR